MRALAVALVLTSLVQLNQPISLSAQSLSSRPVIFADPVPGRATPGRELELGVTTLTAAKRIFAVELDEPVQVRRGFAGNPARVKSGTEWVLMGHPIRPEQSLDLGPDHYTLYFDGNQRLIGASTNRLPRRLARDVFEAHYPQARLDRRWHSGDVPFDEIHASVGECVVLTAMVRVREAEVERLAYYYTCDTRP